MKLLLGRKAVNPNSANLACQTPLVAAAEDGLEGIVKLLLKRRDINTTTLNIYYRRILLSWAAKNGCEGTVKLLLERKNVNFDGSSKSGETPLSRIIEMGHPKLLLERRGVNSSSLGGYSRTLLWLPI